MERLPLPCRHHFHRLQPPPWRVTTAAVFLLFRHCLPGLTFASDGLVANFEGIDAVESYAPWQLRGDNLAVVPGGPDGKGHCLRADRTKPASHCSVRIEGPIVLEKNLLLAFDYRTEIEAGFEGAYLGMTFYVDGKQWFFRSHEFSDRWRHAEIELGRLHEPPEHVLRPGMRFSSINIYARVKEQTSTRGETKARAKLWLDNLRLKVAEPETTLSDEVRTSYSNPPMFVWSPTGLKQYQRLQYSRDPKFPETHAKTVETSCDFHTPRNPLEPGTWYWRVWNEGELFAGYSPIARVVVPPEAHRFTTSPVPTDQIVAMPRPRLIECAKIDQPPVDEERRASLVRSAKKLFEQGVPEHPGPHVAGDPRWPTWIDWYGKVAGGITGRTGRRLQQIAQYAMLTADPQVIAWTKQLALDACRWDAEGGSAMRYGDIGAQHLLRGLNWCYDACGEHMTPDEQRQLQAVIVQRAEQFHKRLKPFRGNEANNHSWLQALALGESGLVLAGDHEEAAEWAEYVRQLFVGRFLCCLGYQGDNNEGISYWGYGLGFVIDYADLMKAVCTIDLYQHPWLNQTARFPMYCAPPGAWAVSFADTGKPNHSVRGPAQCKQVRELAIRTRDPYSLWYSGEREPVDGLTPKAPADLPPSIHYRHIGWVIFNTTLVDGREGATVAMHSGPYYAGHQHPDQNSFVINAYGEKLAIDGGYYDWYGSAHFNAYSMTTAAHNTLLIDGQGQAVRRPGADGRVARYFDSPDYAYTVGDASNPEIYQGKLKQFDRRIVFLKPGFVVTHDLVTAASAPVRVDWLLHAVTPIEIDSASRQFTITCDRATLRGRLISPARLALQVTTGFPVEPVDGYSTRPVPPEKYVPEWHLTATPKDAAEKLEILTAMQIQRTVEPVHAEASMEPVEAEGALGVRLLVGKQTHLVLLRRQAATGPIAGGGMECDGEASALELDDHGKPIRAMAIQATYLRYNGQTIQAKQTPADWAGEVELASEKEPSQVRPK